MTDNYVIDTTTIDSGIHIGGTTLYENDVKEIMVLLDIIKELDDDNPIKHYTIQKMLDKMKVNNE